MCNVQPEEETDSLRCFYKSNLLKNYELEPSDNIQAYCFAIMMSASSRHSCYISLFVYYKFVTVTLLLPLQVQADEFGREMLHPTFTHVKLVTWVKFECTWGEREIEHIYLKNSNSNIDETEFFYYVPRFDDVREYQSDSQICDIIASFTSTLLKMVYSSSKDALQKEDPIHW